MMSMGQGCATNILKDATSRSRPIPKKAEIA